MRHGPVFKNGGGARRPLPSRFQGIHAGEFMSQSFRHIDQLRGWRQSAFILALAERAFPNYALFAQLTGQLDPEPLRRGLDSIWTTLSDRDAKPNFLKAAERVEQQLPEQDRFEGYGVHPATDACNLVLDALTSRLKPDAKLALAAAQLALNTVTTFVEINDAEGVEEDDLVHHLDRHPLVRQELTFQRELQERLRRTSYPAEAFLRELYTLAANDGISNIGIAVESGD